MDLANIKIDKITDMGITTSDFIKMPVKSSDTKSKVMIGDLTVYITQRFNWFQKKMIRFCFGLVIEDIK